MAKEVMLTTIDNPFNPFTEYDEWLRFDKDNGYYTNEYLARVSYSSNELSLADEEEAIEVAIDEIISLNVLGIYKKVSKQKQ